MANYQRYSPIVFEGKQIRTERRDGWEVVLEYGNEGQGPHLIDLSHRPKWDVQDGDLSRIRPLELAIPEVPGQVALKEGLLISRMNRTQAAIWHLFGKPVQIGRERSYTDTTDGVALMALMGKGIFSILEKACPLDLAAPGRTAPFVFQGPIFHVPCQIVVLRDGSDLQIVLIGCSRGYGQSMAEALLDAGSSAGLRPAGEAAFIESAR